jgi:catechol 2,3-dioxygenase-like lactoylglutathione lyase family enzyme
MQLNHIGINIIEETDIQQFYLDILQFEPDWRFTLPDEISRQFFGISQEPKVVVLKNGQLKLELFVHEEPLTCGYSHLCIEVDDREEIARKCAAAGFPVLRKKRKQGDLIFIKDRSGNVFELKNKIR